MTEKQYIDRYINFYTDTKVKQRGKQLYKNNAVDFRSYDEKTDTYLFKVKGSRLYDVSIKNLNKKDITTFCTCPYDWGSVCKHTVATLLFLAENKNIELIDEVVETKKTTTERRAVKEELVLEDFKIITDELIKRNTTPSTYNSLYRSDIEVGSVLVENNKVTFDLKRSFDGFVNSYNKTDKVIFEIKDNKLHINSTETTHVAKGKLKLTEAFCLLSIVNSNTANFFDLLQGDEIKVAKHKATSSYGLNIEDFDKYFKINFEINNGLVVIKKEPAFGLISVKHFDKEFVGKLFNELSGNDVITHYSNNKELSIGFVLNKDNDYYYSDVAYSYMPITAKPNKAKTKLISKFNRLYDVSNEDVEINNEQAELINSIRMFNNSKDADAFNLSKRIFLGLLNQNYVYVSYKSEFRFSKNNLQSASLSPNLARVVIDVKNEGRFISAKIKLFAGNKEFTVNDIDEEKSDGVILSYNNVLYHLKTYKDVIAFNELGDGLRMVSDYKDEFFKNVIFPLSKNFEINFGENTYNNTKIELDFKSRQIYISEKDDFIVFQPQVVYDNNVSVLLSSEGNYLHKDDETGDLTEYIRNFDLEADFLETISELHPNFETQKENKYFYLSFDEFTEKLWFYKFFDELNVQNIELYGLKELKKFKYSPHKGKIVTSIKSGQDWFDVSVEVSFGDNTVSLSDVRKAVLNKEKYIQLKDGSVGIMPEEWLQKLEKYFRNGTVKKDKLEISKLRFSVIDELFENIDQTEIIEELAEKRRRLEQFKEISKTKIPKQIKAELRHYQKEGVNWLNFLNDMKWGGILADDMGLGKTLQILTFIQQIIKKDKLPNLIVVPTTLLFNWKAEIDKFAPELSAFYYYGNTREKNTKEFKKYNLIFTTYGTLLRDIEILNQYKFNYLILDESQAIKNPASRRYKAVNLIQAKNRIALSGTPIENSTFDLYAQMSFVNPGFFGSVNNFKKDYSNPIDKEANKIVADELQSIVNPFILRRTKESVATELPSKTEDVIFCDMETEQRKIYDAYRNEYRNKLLKNVEKNGLAKSKMMVLEALTRLRQICDSPALVKSEDFTNQSIKIKEIVNHIRNKTANHKVLVFSQFVGMLGLLKDELEKLNISYEYLDGKNSNKQREESVNNFQNNNDLRVFLISLKAGGTGLNLTAADYVYLLDPWWNPAVENQAIDRCYRIGQDKKVFAYRMICKNTVEEKILDLQAKKKKIASDIIQTDENVIKTLSVDSIKMLFK